MEYGLIGEHLSHSFSKLIHESIESYKYDLVELAPNELESFLMKRDFKAVNVTIPYKQDVIPYLDEISESAKEVGAVNIIINRNGRLCGYNSDVDGFIYLLDRAGISVKDKNILILGTGGAYKAIRYALDKLGAKSVLVASRSKKPCYISYGEFSQHPEVEVVINATPVGMYPHNEESIGFIDELPNLEGYVDIIYNPINTKNVIECSLNGIKAIGGLYMLIYQAIRSIEIFLDKKINESVVDDIYKKIKREHSNIVLIGMPTSGKSRIAKMLSKKLNIKYLDTDEEIEKEINMSIREYFENFGEKSFRKLESKVVERIYKDSPMVISTGGGIIKNINNIKMLKQNGKIIFINRPLNQLFASKDRPLSSNIGDLRKLYEERLPIYKKYADYEIYNDHGDLDRVVKEILEL